MLLTERRINIVVSQYSADTKNLSIENAAGLWAENGVPSLHYRAFVNF